MNDRNTENNCNGDNGGVVGNYICIRVVSENGDVVGEKVIDEDELAVSTFEQYRTNVFKTSKEDWDELPFHKKLHFQCEAERIIKTLKRHMEVL